MNGSRVSVATGRSYPGGRVPISRTANAGAVGIGKKSKRFFTLKIRVIAPVVTRQSVCFMHLPCLGEIAGILTVTYL